MLQQSINEKLIGIRNKTLVCEKDSNAIKNGLLWLSSNPLRVPASLLYFQLTLVFFVSTLVHYVLKPFNQLSFVSQLIAGIILGPSVLCRNTSLREYIFPDRGMMILETVTTSWVMCLLFTVGVKMDPMIMFHPGRSAIIIATSMCLFSMARGLAIIMSIYLSTDNSIAKSLPYIASEHSLTGFPVISCLLSELRLLNTDLSRLVISASMFYDVIGILISAAVNALSENHGGQLGNSVLEIIPINPRPLPPRCITSFPRRRRFRKVICRKKKKEDKKD